MIALLFAGTLQAAPYKPRRVMPERRGVVVLSALDQAVSWSSPEDIDEPLPVPQALPVSARDRAAAVALEVRAQASLGPLAGAPPTILRTFAAFRDDNTTRPPDTHGAVGPNHVMTATNAAIVVHDRAGAVLTTTSLNNFFATVREATPTFDPRVLYDRFDHRWIVSAASGSRTTLSAALLAVSRTDDPTGVWDLYRYTADPAGKVWFDFPYLGYNDDYIVVTGNTYTLGDTIFNRAVVFIFDKTNPGAPAARFDLPNTGGSFAPVVSYDQSVGTLYFLQRWNGNSQGRGFLRLYTGTLNAVTPVTFVSSPLPWASISGGENGDFAPQAGSPQKIDTGDDRVVNAVLRNGAIWAAHTIFLPAGAAPTRAAVQWFQIALDGKVLQRGTFDDDQGGVFYAFPSIAVNRREDVMIGLTRFSASTLPSAAFGFRPASATDFTLDVFKTGEATYVKPGSSGNRWGDYSATMVDPLNDHDFWTVQEYSGAPVNGIDRWGTWWAQVAPPVETQRRRSVKH